MWEFAISIILLIVLVLAEASAELGTRERNNKSKRM
jgi:hypothetical protein